MKGILYGAQIGVSGAGGLILFLIAFSVDLLGYIADEGVERPRIYWAEWPLTGTKEAEAAPDKGVSKKAA